MHSCRQTDLLRAQKVTGVVAPSLDRQLVELVERSCSIAPETDLQGWATAVSIEEGIVHTSRSHSMESLWKETIRDGRRMRRRHTIAHTPLLSGDASADDQP